MGNCCCFKKCDILSNYEENNNIELNEIEILQTINPSDVKLFTFANSVFNAIPCDVYDGDTFSSIFYWNGQVIKWRCRCLGYDSPEMKPSLKNPNREQEKELAKKAKEYSINELNKTKYIQIKCGKFDKYGRLLVTIYNTNDSSKSLNEKMIEEGHGKPYNGGTKEGWINVDVE